MNKRIFYTVVAVVAGVFAAPRPATSSQFSTPDINQVNTSSSQSTTLNMLAFGADPTGIRDSAPAVRTAVASIGTTTATLYFPQGTYRFASHGATAEECVRIAAPISLQGDGPGLTIFTDDAIPACVAQLGFFWSMGIASRDDYSFETDPGYPVNASTAPLGSATIRLTQASQASMYPPGQYVFLRGTELPQLGEYHGELNLVAAADPNTGTITLAWPLSSSFIQDTGLQLNLVAGNEVLANIQITGITFNFHNNAFLAAQVLGLKIFNNQFNYLGNSPGWEITQFNQIRNAEFNNNTVTNPQGAALDVERTSNTWNIHDNVMYGYFDAGEGGANIRFYNNTITCVGLPICVRVGGTTGNTIDHNHINSSCPSDACHAVTDVTGAITSQNTVISNNTIVVDSPRAISVQSPGTAVLENTISALYTGIDIDAGNILASNNTVTLTGSGPYGCILIEGLSHNSVVQGLTCNSNSDLFNNAVWIADNGPQPTTPAVINGITGNNLSIGIFVQNGQNDSPVIGTVSFTNTLNPFVGRSQWTLFGGH
jgi:hypothetical protein